MLGLRASLLLLGLSFLIQELNRISLSHTVMFLKSPGDLVKIQGSRSSPLASPQNHRGSPRVGETWNFLCKGSRAAPSGRHHRYSCVSGNMGVQGPLGAQKLPGHESLHKCRCSTPRKGSARRGVPGSKAADGSHAWGTVCLPSGTILPAWPPHAVQGQASGLGQWAETAPLGPPAGCKARRKGPKDSLPGSKERERETLTR